MDLIQFLEAFSQRLTAAFSQSLAAYVSAVNALADLEDALLDGEATRDDVSDAQANEISCADAFLFEAECLFAGSRMLPVDLQRAVDRGTQGLSDETRNRTAWSIAQYVIQTCKARAVLKVAA